MNAPKWISSRVSRDEIIKCFAEGRIEGFDSENDDYESHNSVAMIG